MSKRDPSASDSVDVSRIHEVLQTETGGRALTGPASVLLFVIPVVWSLFQLWIASPLPFMFNVGIFNSTEARSIHLAFGTFLAFTAFPMFRGRHINHIPWFDWILALAASFCAAYLYLFYEALSERPGAPLTQDIVVAMVGLVLLLEATRRSLGLPLTIVAAVFIGYSLAGPWMPDVISHRGASLSKLASHQWLGTEGVFGVPLGVSTSFVFLFVLFGSLLEKAGAGNYFIQVTYALLGHMRGGPAKAAVVSSGLSGIISGSSIANVVTTGTFTIPLMKRVGFPATKAGAVEVAASTNGQLTPPVMGAAAFLIMETVGVSYLEVVKHAILPALISYIALIYIVHLEACKLGMKGIERLQQATLAQKMLKWSAIILLMCLLTAVVYYGLGWIKDVMGDAAVWAILPLLLVSYLGLVYLAAKQEPLGSAEDADMEHLPRARDIVTKGLHFLLPVVVLVWCLAVEQFSAPFSAFWATLFMVFVVITQRPLLSLFRGAGSLGASGKAGVSDLLHAMATGARNMVGIGVATATAGIVVGTVTLTGLGQVMAEFVEFISGGHLMLILIFTALICLILGMGLPTTANYIVVSSLMAPVIVTLGAENGLLVPLIAVHLFVFYFGILADDTPPVGLAAYAAAAISGADPIRTGVQGFMYDIRTAVLPFMFIFNTQLLLIGLTGPVDLIITIVSAVVAILAFSAATQGYWLTRSYRWESALLILIGFTLFRPGFWWDRIYPEYEERPGAELVQQVEALAEQPGVESVMIQAGGLSLTGDEERTTWMKLPLAEGDNGEDRLMNMGIEGSQDGEVYAIDFVGFDSAAKDAGLDFGWTINTIRVPQDRPPRELVYIPAVILLLLIGWLQVRRRRRENPPEAAPAT